ncbi:MAG: leucyl/phenylalanyl-tRNA--protein transferase [Ignavibacteriales bacterium]|nr:leucyl/phenylalanyl-tRNA--protein transferase [Ignavibacteriales bacterium]
MKENQTWVGIIDPDFLLKAYCSGFFPMADGVDGEIGWYSPDPRAIFELNELQIPRSLSLTIKKQPFEILIDTRFEDVMRECAARKETWISEEIIQSYVRLHQMGFAHSVECWKEDVLVGGLYGVAIRGAFFGESMFSRMRDASKVALVSLVDRLREREYELLDTQFVTEHLARFGAKEITRDEYLRRLKKALKQECTFYP